MSFRLSDNEAATFAERGALRVHTALDKTTLRELFDVLADRQPDHAGVRLRGVPGLLAFLMPSGSVGEIPAALIGDNARPVRCILFDKTPSANWAVPWHQDRTIVVQERIDVVGFGPWTTKGGLLHVAPPDDVLARMVTVRVHLDPVPETNAPLLIAPGSHRLGRIPEAEVQAIVQRCGTATCYAEAGDIWIYKTLILHASDAASKPDHRRVLQVDFVDFDLPSGLRWLGV
jgi:hypothetical protein